MEIYFKNGITMSIKPFINFIFFLTAFLFLNIYGQAQSSLAPLSTCNELITQLDTKIRKNIIDQWSSQWEEMYQSWRKELIIKYPEKIAQYEEDHLRNLFTELLIYGLGTTKELSTIGPIKIIEQMDRDYNLKLALVRPLQNNSIFLGLLREIKLF